MEKTFKLDNLACAHCADKMENAIRKIKGVEEANISFMSQKLYLRAADAAFAEIVEKAGAAIRRIEPDCSIHM